MICNREVKMTGALLGFVTIFCSKGEYVLK